ncbi:MAG: hypothetical protein PHO20_02580 [Candidatus Peribacteraceae bacterium]|nr:hypothetical protein [Candidatus Peribacteraceae bacterium]MDD5739630.1 hypothetical protein [Candidatus Peribacteraceae bacterium]
MTTHPHLTVDELSPEEVERAFVLVQQDKDPKDIIHALRGQEAQLLDPDQFPRDVQRRRQELPHAPESNGNETDDEA